MQMVEQLGDSYSSPLTTRELEVLQLVAKFRTNHEIASHLKISDKTVEYHLANIFSKLGVDSRRDAARLVWQGRSPER